MKAGVPSTTPVRVRPTSINLAGNVATYVEDGAPVVLDVSSNVIVSDVDSNDFAGGSLTVAISAYTS